MKNLAQKKQYSARKYDDYFYQVFPKESRNDHLIYFAPATISTPEVKFDVTHGKLKIGGRSNAENPLIFFQSLYNHIDKMLNRLVNKFYVEIALDYFNTSSAKCIYELLKKLNKVNQINSAVTIIWCHEEEDIDMLESGKDYEYMLGLDFVFKSLSSQIEAA